MNGSTLPERQHFQMWRLMTDYYPTQAYWSAVDAIEGLLMMADERVEKGLKHD